MSDDLATIERAWAKRVARMADVIAHLQTDIENVHEYIDAMQDELDVKNNRIAELEADLAIRLTFKTPERTDHA